MQRRYQLIDTETGGFDPVAAGICELAFIEVDEQFNVLDRQHSLIDPEKPISPSAAGVHGIRDCDVEDAPTMDEFISVVLEKHPWEDGELVFIAHNAKFDYKFLEPYIRCPVVLCDTLKLARRIYPEAPDHKLQTLRHWLDLPFDKGDAHSAAGDTNVLFHFVARMMRDSGLDLPGLVELANEWVPVLKMPFGKHKGKDLAELVSSRNGRQYVEWLLGQDNVDPDLRRSFEMVM